MMDIKSWFSRIALIPVSIAAVIAFLSWISISYLQYSQQVDSRRKSLDQLESALSIGILQHNRVLLETLLQAAIPVLNSESAAICQGTKLILSVSSNQFECNIQSSVFKVVTKRNIQGFETYDLIVVSSRLSGWTSWILTIAIGLMFVVTSLAIVRRTRRLLEVDLIYPLQDGLLNNKPQKIQELNLLQQKIAEANATKTQLAVAEATVLRSAQVAHDIRSPLSALKILVGIRKSEETVENNLLRQATDRISRIVEDLRRSDTPSASTNDLKITLDEIIAEKRVEYSESLDQASIKSACVDSILIDMDRFDLHRVLSNVLNNAIEAHTETKPKVQVVAKQIGTSAVIEICDEGKGVPEELMDSLGKAKFTFGKKSGSGLGLFHAKMTLTKYRGSISFRRNPVRGTTVEIQIPISNRIH